VEPEVVATVGCPAVHAGESREAAKVVAPRVAARVVVKVVAARVVVKAVEVRAVVGSFVEQ